ncbi:MAG TPA: PAS domain S-box protein [Gemmatimonadales bacterium]|nr:PAS domain S-box protein [Gemmatimonadales bacterium]
MSKARRSPPGRDIRSPPPSSPVPPGGPPPEAGLDLQQAAADIVAALPDAVIVTGTDRRVLAVNQPAADLLGCQAAELVGQPTADHVAPAERAHVASREDKVLAGETQRYDTRVLNRQSGEERDVAVSSGPFRVRGELIGTLATLRDFTDQKRAHDTLARSEARYRNLVESASDAIVTLDANGRFTTVNHAAEIVSGYRREELVGQWFAPMLPDDELPKALAHFQQALAGETGLFETQFYRKDGETRTISVTYSTPQRDEEVLCLIRDVTDQKMLQEQLIQSEKMSAIGQLVSGVAHELNNPLAGISAFAQLLLAEKRFPPDQRTAAETIYSESRRASRIVQNLLTFARQHKAEKVPTAINQVLDDTLELRGYELSVRGIDVRRAYDDQLPETMADAHQLQQVFLNLITNAEQAMERVEGRHHCLTVHTKRAGDGIRIEIEDTGPGIPVNLLERIFNPFFTTKPTGSGTGLGLSISLGLVREHDGRIWAENAPQGGARFVIELPLIAPRGSGEFTAMPSAPHAGDSLHVLVVDDEASVRVALQRYLSGRGHQVETTHSGQEAMTRLRSGAYDAVILDMRMPDLSGEQLFEELRASDPEHAERVIFTTGDLVSEPMRRFLNGSGRPCVTKPFELSAFDPVLPAARRRA